MIASHTSFGENISSGFTIHGTEESRPRLYVDPPFRGRMEGSALRGTRK